MTGLGAWEIAQKRRQVLRTGPLSVGGTGGFNGSSHTAELGLIQRGHLLSCDHSLQVWSAFQQRQLVQPALCPQGPLASSDWRLAGGWFDTNDRAVSPGALSKLLPVAYRPPSGRTNTEFLAALKFPVAQPPCLLL